MLLTEKLYRLIPNLNPLLRHSRKRGGMETIARADHVGAHIWGFSHDIGKSKLKPIYLSILMGKSKLLMIWSMSEITKDYNILLVNAMEISLLPFWYNFKCSSPIFNFSHALKGTAELREHYDQRYRSYSPGGGNRAPGESILIRG